MRSSLSPNPSPLHSRRQRFNNPFYWNGRSPRFVTTADLMRDAHTLACMLPDDTELIVGISRSGLCVATMVSMILHKPMAILRQSLHDIVPAGNGWRLGKPPPREGTVVVVDDTVMTGNSFKDCLPVARAQWPSCISAAVYCNPAARHKPDLWAIDLPAPHVLAWNLPNSVHSPHCALDFDGILCRDCRPEEDDDGLGYLRFIETAPLLYPWRRLPIPLIVTARLEKYREPTVSWLDRQGMQVEELVMHPAASLAERNQDNIAAYKAKHFARFMNRRHAIQPAMFVESDPRQAQKIAQLSGGIVVCPAAERCFP